MLTTNQEFLHLELMEVVRLFLPSVKEQDGIDIEHKLFYENEKFINLIKIDNNESRFENEYSYRGDIEYKRYAKRYSKLAMYKVLSKFYSRHLPWGALTGIRPVKMAYSEIAEGRDFVKLYNEMDVCEENIKLVQDVINVQKPYYKIDDDITDLFVSIPFCPSKCSYCSFITAPLKNTKQYLDDYVEAICKELLNSKDYLGNLSSVYVGGGTPLVLNEEHLQKILSTIKQVVSNDKIEFTVEAGRPDVFTKEKLSILKEYDVNRICINPQTFSNETLKRIGRKHTAEDIYKAFDLCNDFDFIINCDLIAGLTGESVEEFCNSIDKVVKLNPHNVTVHTLCLKKGARLREEVDKLEDDKISAMVNYSKKVLYKENYLPYYMYRQKYMAGNLENLGWSKKGFECIYNINIMEEISNNVAVGANAVSKRLFKEENRLERYGSPKDIKTYIDKVDLLISNKTEFFR